MAPGPSAALGRPDGARRWPTRSLRRPQSPARRCASSTRSSASSRKPTSSTTTSTPRPAPRSARPQDPHAEPVRRPQGRLALGAGHVESSVTLTVASQYGVDLNFTSVDLTLSLDDFSASASSTRRWRSSRPTSRPTRSRVLYKDVYNTVTTAGVSATFNKVLNARKLLVDNLAPSGRVDGQPPDAGQPRPRRRAEGPVPEFGPDRQPVQDEACSAAPPGSAGSRTRSSRRTSTGRRSPRSPPTPARRR
jgi:hypothetical protein